ncbi:hypothetical protein O159_15150 [Leifsonia xyli subsp. cynodontis DSM 46306]|uniref:DUF4031 domain-containing protein n=1 Tax=Leifsonia xyli subsp. cynodontis DSM 46306 TaxID=1389489 RepID=U3P6X5_LEIXC|nr:hypothetical protein O159_15150 [Leifsonia xyli subsp. cynodontis DSM 46306]
MLWSHLVSDSSIDELHAFAAAAGVPARAFDLDHYDIPDKRYDELIAAGALPVPGKELVSRLIASALRSRRAPIRAAGRRPPRRARPRR